MSEYFPTKFALKLAIGSELCPKEAEISDYHNQMEEIKYDLDIEMEEFEEEHGEEEASKERKKLEKKWKRKRKMIQGYENLIEFQNLSVGTDFESALIAYEGMELTEEQKTVLLKIHESTFDWVKGRMVDKMITKIEKTESAREIKELTDALLLLMNGGSESAGLDAKKIAAYVVNTQ